MATKPEKVDPTDAMIVLSDAVQAVEEELADLKAATAPPAFVWVLLHIDPRQAASTVVDVYATQAAAEAAALATLSAETGLALEDVPSWGGSDTRALISGRDRQRWLFVVTQKEVL